MLFHGLFFPNSKRHCPMCILVSLPIQVHGRLGHKRAAGKEKQGHSADSASLQTPNGCSVSCFSKQLCMKLLLGVVCTSCCSSGDFHVASMDCLRRTRSHRFCSGRFTDNGQRHKEENMKVTGALENVFLHWLGTNDNS